jgi:hypothetical protein
MEESLRILRSFPPTPEREEKIGRLFANQTLSGLWAGRPDS